MVANSLTGLLTKVAMLAVVVAVPSLAHAQSSDPWVAAAESRLADTRTYPRSAQVRKEAGTAVISLQVDGNGLITGYQIARSSGSEILDREAERALDRIGQFTPTPDRKPRTVAVRVTWPGPQDKLIN